MKANLRKLQKRRVFSEELKREIVSLFESGKFSVLLLEKLYGISDSAIYRWIYKFSTFNEKGIRVVEMKESSVHKLKELEAYTGFGVMSLVWMGLSGAVVNTAMLWVQSGWRPSLIFDQQGAHVGIGANIIQGVTVGENAMIGAGTVVLNDVPAHAVVVGNPGKIIKMKQSNNGE